MGGCVGAQTGGKTPQNSTQVTFFFVKKIRKHKVFLTGIYKICRTSDLALLHIGGSGNCYFVNHYVLLLGYGNAQNHIFISFNVKAVFI